jgi:hypothetical protein
MADVSYKAPPPSQQGVLLPAKELTLASVSGTPTPPSGMMKKTITPEHFELFEMQCSQLPQQ